MALRVALYLKDNVFSHRLVDYINIKYSDNIRVYQYTDSDSFLDNIETLSVDVILLDEPLELSGIDSIRNAKICILTEKLEESSRVGENNEQYIFKYQKASLICVQMLDTVSKETHVLFKRNEGDTQIWGFASLKGGAGASTVSSAFAIYLARTGKKVLFLNMHVLGNSSSCFYGGEQGQGNFDDIILSLKTARGGIHSKLLSTICRSDYGVYYYKGASNPYDIGELRDADIERLFSSLRETDFESIVIDFELGFDDYNWALMNSSDRIVLVSDGTNSSKNNLGDTIKIVDYLDKKKKTRTTDKLMIVNNKISSGSTSEAENDKIRNIGTIDEIAIDDMERLAVHIAGNRKYFSFGS